MNKTHDLKTWPEYFNAILTKEKLFEIRENDRDFRVGDILRLIEFVPCVICHGFGTLEEEQKYSPLLQTVLCTACQGTKGEHTGRAMLFHVGYILHDFAGLKDDYIAMQLKEIVVEGSALVKQPNEGTRQTMSAALYRMAEWVAKGGRLVQGSAKAGSPQVNLLRIQMDMTIAKPEEDTPRIIQ